MTFRSELLTASLARVAAKRLELVGNRVVGKTTMVKLSPPSKRGEGIKKMPVVGADEGGGSVVSRIATDLMQKGILWFNKDVIKWSKDAVLMTDEFVSYHAVDDIMPH